MKGFLLGIAACSTLMVSGAEAQTPMEVISDTAVYCAQLEARLAGAMTGAPPTAEVRTLAETGHRLCHAGAIRAGITQLRRALVSIHISRGALPGDAHPP